MTAYGWNGFVTNGVLHEHTKISVFSFSWLWAVGLVLHECVALQFGKVTCLLKLLGRRDGILWIQSIFLTCALFVEDYYI